eukprot:tig00021015_g17151.t1
MFFNTQQEPTTRDILADPEITGVPTPKEPRLESKLVQYADDAAHSLKINPRSPDPGLPVKKTIAKYQKAGRYNGSSLNLSKTEGMLAGAAAPPKQPGKPTTLPEWTQTIPIRWVKTTSTLDGMRSRRARWNLRAMRVHQRVYVATAIVASVNMYAAAFLPCPPAALRAIKDEYWAAIWPPSAEASPSKRTARGRISRAKAVLPPSHGGLGALDVESRLLAQAEEMPELVPKKYAAAARALGLNALGAELRFRSTALAQPATKLAAVHQVTGPAPQNLNPAAYTRLNEIRAQAILPEIDPRIWLAADPAAKQKTRWPDGRTVAAGRLDRAPWIHAGLLYRTPAGPRPWLQYRISAGYRALRAQPARPEPGPLARFGPPPPGKCWTQVWRTGTQHAHLSPWNRETWLWATHACLPAGRFLFQIGARPSPYCCACPGPDVPPDTSDHAIFYCEPARGAWEELLDRWNTYYGTSIPLDCAHALTGFLAVPDDAQKRQTGSARQRREFRMPRSLLAALAGLMISAAWSAHARTLQDHAPDNPAGSPQRVTKTTIWRAFERAVWARVLLEQSKIELTARGLPQDAAQPSLDPDTVAWSWEPADPDAPQSTAPNVHAPPRALWTADGFIATAHRSEAETTLARGPLLDPQPESDSDSASDE